MVDDPRFWAKVEKSPGCWLWNGNSISGAHNTNGAAYGTVSRHGKTWYAHRYAYTLVVGPIPNGLTIDHLCGVTLCVRPDHLQAVSQRVNILRGGSIAAVHSRQTHCAHGHLLPERKPGATQRRCQTCKNESARRSYHRDHAATRERETARHRRNREQRIDYMRQYRKRAA